MAHLPVSQQVTVIETSNRLSRFHPEENMENQEKGKRMKKNSTNSK